MTFFLPIAISLIDFQYFPYFSDDNTLPSTSKVTPEKLNSENENGISVFMVYKIRYSGFFLLSDAIIT